MATSSSFSDTFSSCSHTRRLYSKLFKVPSSYDFVTGSVHDKLLIVYNGHLYSVNVTDLHLDAKGWKLIANERPSVNTRYAQLLQERMRLSGRSKPFDIFIDDEVVLLHGSSPQLVNFDGGVVLNYPHCEGGLCLQICPFRHHLVACVMDGDLFLLDAHTATLHQLTYTKNAPKLSAGFPPYIVQEEFDRYIGFMWQNKDTADGTLWILYEEVNEEDVEVLHTFNPVTQTVEDYMYPRPGKTNAKSVLKLLMLKYGTEEKLSVEELMMSVPLNELFPHCCEYLVRYGWMPGGEAIWIQLLNRQQTHLILAVINIDSFVPLKPGEMQSTFPSVYILWEEKSSVWISVSDCLEFLPADGNSKTIRFVWLSESSGYKHLYLVEAVPPEFPSTNQDVSRAQFTCQPITSGKWSVLGSKVWIDFKSEVVYFQANKSSPVQKHLYAVNLFTNDEPRQLTAPGFCHDITIDTKNFKYFLSTFSNASSGVSVAIHSLAPPHEKISELQGHSLPENYQPPIYFNVNSASGEALYGAVYRPENLKLGEKAPTILYVYGGPGIQMVTCALSKQLARIQSWRRHGYAVVVLDNRGSSNRGLQFESFVKGRMGLVEIEDQVLGLKTASETVDFIDLNRVGIMGWSYGGYLSLMAIAEYPALFKVSISGAPVTDWFYYDTAYTERYLGIPHDINDDAYCKSSVVKKATKLPSESGRLLLLHGLNDENVLFTHTASLCAELISHGKPYVMQFYPGERHGLRSLNNVIHCDATILEFLNVNL